MPKKIEIWFYKTHDITGMPFVILSKGIVPKLSEDMIPLGVFEGGSEEIITDSEQLTSFINSVILKELDSQKIELEGIDNL